MLIRSVQTHFFRNLQPQTIELNAGINVFVGGNGQGKTNFLEAIHVLSMLRSFRLAKPREMIQHEKSCCDLVAHILRQDIPITLRLQLESKARKMWLGQRSVSGVSDYLGNLDVVAFTPDDLGMIKGAPALRRRFIDRAAFLFSADHLHQLRSYNAALRARNRLLSATQVDSNQLAAFGMQLAAYGSRVSAARLELLRRLMPIAQRFVQSLFDESYTVHLQFRSGWGKIDLTPETLMRELEKRETRDRARQLTSCGSQLDDFDIVLQEASARRFASQGQQRVCAIALLLSVVELLSQSAKMLPVMLLDDVSSELDAGVRNRLFAYVKQLSSQVLVTTTDTSYVSDLSDCSHQRFQVVAGTIWH